MGKGIKFVDLSYVESKYVMNCYVFISIFEFFIVGVEYFDWYTQFSGCGHMYSCFNCIKVLICREMQQKHRCMNKTP